LTIFKVGLDSVTYTDATIDKNKRYYYRVQANNVVGDTTVYPVPAVGFPTTSADSAASETAVTPAVQSLKIENSVDPKTYFAVGDLLDYDYTVTNTGNVDITGPITVKDDMFGSKKISYNGLAPGQSVTGKASHLVTPSDIYAGFKSNSAYATGSFANKEVTSNSDTATTRFFGPNANILKE
jgi:hypothetical protein